MYPLFAPEPLVAQTESASVLYHKSMMKKGCISPFLVYFSN
ncbi:hypothetical protein [Bacillus thuringiensis]|nr:hypothetical protein [Bacillus thuringiensis]